MTTKFHVGHRAVSRLAISLGAVLLWCAAASAQLTQIAPNPNPAGNTVSIAEQLVNSVDYVNNGTISTVEDTPWHFINYHHGTFSNAGTINLNNSTYRPQTMEVIGGALYNDTDGFVNEGVFTNELTGTINNHYYLQLIGNDTENHGAINNHGVLMVRDLTNHGTIVNNSLDYDRPSIHGSLYLIGVSSRLYNYGDIINEEGTIALGFHSRLYNYGTITNISARYDVQSPSGQAACITYLVESPSFLRNFGTIDNRVGSHIASDHLNFENYPGSLLINAGTIDFGVWLMNYESTIENTGTIRILEDTYTINSENSVIHNHETGTIINETSEAIMDNYAWNGGTIINDGMFENLACITSSGTFENNGTFDNSSGTFENYFTTIYGVYCRGTFQGVGTFIGHLNTGRGIIAPGNSAGTMTVVGDFTLSAGGTLEIEIGGFDAGESDFLDITGSAFLLEGGTISFSFLDDYDIKTDLPNRGDSLSWLFLEADEGISTFLSSFNFDFPGGPTGFVYNVYQQGNGLWFEATNIPVPGAAILGLLGLSSAAGLIRRRNAR